MRRCKHRLAKSDSILQAGSIEGQVVEIGLTSTSLINTEKLPVIVPNSLFSSQVISKTLFFSLCFKVFCK